MLSHYFYRRVRSGAVDAHPTEPAIVVNYELDAYVLGENGEPVISNHKVIFLFLILILIKNISINVLKS